MSDAEPDLKIQTPCPKSWDELLGDERKRFCSECSLHVHNSAGLTRREAEGLVKGADGGRVCMRIVQDSSGAPVYLDSSCADDARPVTAPKGVGRLATWALAAGAGLLAACRDALPLGHSGGLESPGGGQEGSPMGVVGPNWQPNDGVPCADPQVGAPELLGEVELPVGFEELGDVAFPSDIGTDGDADACANPDADAPPEEPSFEIMGRIAAPPPVAPHAGATPDDAPE